VYISYMVIVAFLVVKASVGHFICNVCTVSVPFAR